MAENHETHSGRWRSLKSGIPLPIWLAIALLVLFFLLISARFAV